MTSDEKFLQECEEYIRTLPDGQMSVQVYRNPFIRLVSIARCALAAAARQGGDVQQAPAESPQSGPAQQGNAQKVQP